MNKPSQSNDCNLQASCLLTVKATRQDLNFQNGPPKKICLHFVRLVRTPSSLIMLLRVHCKKIYWFPRPQPGCHLSNSPWPGIIDIPSGDGAEIDYLFYSVLGIFLSLLIGRGSNKLLLPIDWRICKFWSQNVRSRIRSKLLDFSQLVFVNYTDFTFFLNWKWLRLTK
jgi:hypothetical protein